MCAVAVLDWLVLSECVLGGSHHCVLNCFGGSLLGLFGCGCLLIYFCFLFVDYRFLVRCASSGRVCLFSMEFFL